MSPLEGLGAWALGAVSGWWSWRRVRLTWEEIQREQEQRRRVNEAIERARDNPRDSREGQNGWH